MSIRGTVITKEATFFIETCCQCGVAFGIPSDLQKELHSRLGTSFYCPNGHGQHYTGKTEEQRLQEELATTKAHLRSANESWRRAAQDAKHFESKANGYKGQLALVKKRVANGVCPCCNRYFVELHRHMQSKHMDFLEESGILVAFESSTPEGFDAAVEKACKGVAKSTAAQYRSVAGKIKGFLFSEVQK